MPRRLQRVCSEREATMWKTRRSGIGIALLLALLLAGASASAVDAPDALGPQKVGYAQLTIVDAARANRTLPLDIWYPADLAAWTAEPSFTLYDLGSGIGIDSTEAKDDIALPAAGSYPLVVFSHGFGGLSLQSVPLMEQLASHGFVVVAPSHTGNTQDDSSSPNPEADRFPDIAFVIDEMAAANSDAGSAFFGHVDATNVGVAGHSYGGMTAQFMAAGYGGAPADPRVKAIVPVAPSSASLSDEQLAGITIPTTLIVGTLDGLQPQALRSFNGQASAPDLSLVEVIGANHTHFANVCDIAQALIDAGLLPQFWYLVGAAALVPIYESTCIPPAFPIEAAVRLQNLYATATFRRYLLGETDYSAYLTHGYAATEPDVRFSHRGLIPGEVPALPPLAFGGLALALGAAGALCARRRR
jgi:predicted dienelactone hydrolase